MTMTRVLDLFECLCDADEDTIRQVLASEPEEVQERVLGMLAADREVAALPDEEEVAWALAEDLIDELSDLPACWTPPRLLPDLELIRELGRGGMGVVYEARQHQPQRQVAVKFLGPAYENAALEAQALASLRHPAIPIIYQVGEHQGAIYLVMERVRGQHLLEWAEPRTLRERLVLFLALCDAVRHAHDAGILHRDLKPTNVLVDGDAPWVLDFGLALQEDDVERGVIGTLPYIADEILAGGPATPASDVFSLGVLLAELLGGPRPTSGSRGSVGAQRRMRLKRPPTAWGHEDPQLCSIVRRAVAPVEGRYQGVPDLVRDVRAWLERRPVVAHRGGWTYGLRLFAVRNPVGIGLTISVLVMVGALLWPQVRTWQEGVRRERYARTVLSGVDLVVDRALRQNDHAEALEAVEGALADPAVRRTAAAARTLARLGEGLFAAGERDAGTRILGRAYIESADVTARHEVADRLVEPLVGRRAWRGLRALASHLPEEHGRDLELLAAGGLRDLGTEVPEELAWLKQARRVGYRPLTVAVEEDGDLQLFEVDRQRVVVVGPDGREKAVHPFFDLRWRPHAVPWEDGVLYAVQELGDHGLSVWHVGEAGVRRLGHHSDAGKPLSMARMSRDDGSQVVLIGAGPERRRLLLFEPGTGRWGDPGFQISSDPTGLEVGDVDDDGEPDLVLTTGPWADHAVRLLQGPPGALRSVERGRIGGDARAAIVERADGQAVVVQKVDAYPNPMLFGEEHPVGIPAGVYLIDRGPDGWEVLDHLPSAPGHVLDSGIQVGDFDGDGDQDLAITDAGYGENIRLIRMGPDGFEDERWLGGLRAMGVADTDGDGDDELLVRLHDDASLWVLGDGDRPLPPQTADDELPHGPELGPVADLIELGLFDEALQVLESNALSTMSPDQALQRWTLLADLALREDELLLAERAWRQAISIDPDDPALQDRLNDVLAAQHRFGSERGTVRPDLPVIPPTVLDPVRDLGRFDVLMPQVFDARSDGLHLQGVGPDGRLLRAPVRQVGPHLAVELDLTWLEAELGGRLVLRYVDAEGRSVLGVEVRPFGGGRDLARSFGCTGVLALALSGSTSPLRPQSSEPEEVSIRASTLAGHSACQVERREFPSSTHRMLTGDRPVGEAVAVELLMDNLSGYESSAVEVVLRRIRLEGVELGPVEPSPRLEWVTGDPGAAMEALVGSALEPALAARMGDVARARRTRDQLEPLMWMGAMRRSPSVWTVALVDRPEALARRYAAGFTRMHRSAPLDRLEETFGMPMVDRFDPNQPEVRRLLLHRAMAMLEAGRPARAARILEGLDAAWPENRPWVRLLRARATQDAGRPEEAARLCEQALTISSDDGMFDRIAASPSLQAACGRPGNDLLLDGTRISGR